jgi:adenylate cyclase
MIMKKKYPFIVILGLSGLILLAVYRFFEYRAQLSDDFEQFQLYREEKMLSYSEIGRQLIREQKLKDLKTLMEVARKSRDIDFYIAQYKGSALLLGAYGDQPEVIDIEYPITDQFMRGTHVSTLSTQVDSETKFTVGINRSFDNHFRIMLSQQQVTEIQIVIGPLLLFLLLAAYFFNDIKSILEKLRSRGRRDFKNQTSKSIEAEILAGALIGYTENQQLLESRTRVLENQVLPSLKSEILSGLTPPYTFECTLVRTDINNFSCIFNKYDSEQLMAVINDFFTELSHIVARYDGLIHQFIGDEVIFYIKDQPHEYSSIKALSALRDINLCAERYHQFTFKKWGYPFTVKSTIGKGALRFGHLVSGFTLAGAVLIETVRVLSHIVEKDENTICFNQDYASELQPVCESRFYAEVNLKGYTDYFKLVRYQKHLNLDTILAQLSSQNVWMLKYYRSDSDLFKILNELRTKYHFWGETLAFAVVEILRKVRVSCSVSKYLTVVTSQVATELLGLLDSLYSEPIRNQDEFRVINETQFVDFRSKLLSACCTLIQNLISPAEFENYFETRILVFLEHSNHRVVANIIDVIVYFRHEKTEQTLRLFLVHTNVRIASNALVYVGSRAITSDLIQRLKVALASQNPNIVAGALYALGEIASHHRQADSVYYNSQVEFLNLVSEIPKFQKSENAMVSRQAVNSLRKAS